MDKFAIIDLQEKSKLRAEARKQEWDLAIIDNNRKYAEGKLASDREYLKGVKKEDRAYAKANKKGVYEVDSEGNLLYLVDGVANTVKKSDGSVVGIVEKDQYTDKIIENKDGTITVITSYKDKSKGNNGIEIKSYGIGADTSNLAVFENIANMKPRKGQFSGKIGKYECAEGQNYLVKDNKLKTIEGKTPFFGTSYKDKAKWINSQTPAIGSFAVWNKQPDGKYGEYGHIGQVIAINEKTGKVTLSEWNAKGDRNYSSDREVSISEIIRSKGKNGEKSGFVHMQGTTGTSDIGVSNYDTAQDKFLATVNISKFDTNARKTMEGLGLKEADVYAYKAKNMDEDKKAKIQSVLDGLNELKGKDGTYESATGFSEALGQLKSYNMPFGVVGGTAEADYVLKANKVINNLVLDNLGKMTGVLTDKDIEVLRSAATDLDVEKSSEEGFAEGLRKLEKKYKEVLGIDYIGKTTTSKPKNFMADYKTQNIKTPSGFVFKTGAIKKQNEFFND